MDVIEFLEEHDIRVWTSGKNVSRGWIGLQCPFCGDDSNHLGIHRKSLQCRCWKCGKHRLPRVISELIGIRYKEAMRIIKSLDDAPDFRDKTENPIASKYFDTGGIVKVALPDEARRHFPKIHRDYLRARNYPPLKTIRKYNLRAVNNFGKYKFSILIPIILEGKIVSFTTRDVTGLRNPKYIAASQDEYPNPKHFIYNIDTVQKGGDAILVEGPTDVWRLGDRSISLLGVQHDENQLVHLYRKKINRLFIFFDNDTVGRREAKKLSKIVSPFAKVVEILSLKLDGVEDPGDLSREEAEVLKETLEMN